MVVRKCVTASGSATGGSGAAGILREWWTERLQVGIAAVIAGLRVRRRAIGGEEKRRGASHRAIYKMLVRCIAVTMEDDIPL